MSAVLELREVGKPVLRGQAYWWKQICDWGRGATFSIYDLDMAGCDRIDNIRDFVRKLERADYLVCTNADETLKRYDRKIFKILKTPRLLPPLTRSGKFGKQGRGQQCMWNTMRMVRSFTKRSLADFSSVEGLRIGEATAASYIKHLSAAGYLDTLEASIGPKPAVYRLNPRKNTGPNPPMILRAQMVYDQNSGEVMAPVVAEAQA